MNVRFEDQSSVTPLSLELDLLRTFVAITDTGSFKSAAELVFRTPSAVSMQVKKLEDVVGRPLFNRDARAVTLTPDGEVLLAYARRLLSLSDEAIGHFRKASVEGVVRLGAPDEFGERFLPNILRRFAVTHPGVVVDVVIDFSLTLRDKVRSGKIDLALISCSGVAREDSNVEVVMEEQLVWAGVKGGCAHLKDPLPVSMWEEGCAWRSNAVEKLQGVGREYRVAYMSAHSAGQKAAVLGNLAVAPLPKSMIEAPLVHLTESDGLPPLGTYLMGLITSSKAGPAAQAVADHIKSACKDHVMRAVG